MSITKTNCLSCGQVYESNVVACSCSSPDKDFTELKQAIEHETVNAAREVMKQDRGIEFDEDAMRRPFNEWFNSDAWRKYAHQKDPRPFEVARWAGKWQFDRLKGEIAVLRTQLQTNPFSDQMRIAELTQQLTRAKEEIAQLQSALVSNEIKVMAEKDWSGAQEEITRLKTALEEIGSGKHLTVNKLIDIAVTALKEAT